MAQQKGSTAKLIWGLESVFKTSPTDGFNMPFNSCSLKPMRALNSAATITGSRNPVEPFSGNKSVSGNIVVPVDSIAMMYWCKAMFGAPGTTGASPYVHEYKIGDTMPSITLETQFPDFATDRYGLYNGCKIGSFGVNFGGDGELVANIGVVGSKYTEGTTPFDAAVAAVSLGRVSNFQAAITEGGSTLSNAREVSVNIDFGLDAGNYVIGASGELGSLPEGIARVSGNIKTLFEDASLLTKAGALTESSLKVTVTGSASSIFEIELQELYYELAAPEIPGPQGLLVDLNFVGFYGNGSEASAAVIRLTNATATAP